jgi:hypothetical protein
VEFWSRSRVEMLRGRPERDASRFQPREILLCKTKLGCAVPHSPSGQFAYVTVWFS